MFFRYSDQSMIQEQALCGVDAIGLYITDTVRNLHVILHCQFKPPQAQYTILRNGKRLKYLTNYHYYYDKIKIYYSK